MQKTQTRVAFLCVMVFVIIVPGFFSRVQKFLLIVNEPASGVKYNLSINANY